jgi:oligopeptide transport system ATP-binding protein
VASNTDSSDVEPSTVDDRPMGDREVVVRANDLVKEFPITQGILFRKEIGRVSAVDHVSFELHAGETLALVGESGCGKSTVAKLVMGLETPTSGSVEVYGRDIATLSTRELKELRRRMQIILQDPYTSLDPRMNAGSIVGESIDVHDPKRSAKDRNAQVRDLFDVVGLNPDMVNRFPHQFSGGQRQRIGIARALPFNLGVVVADEPVSALDVSVQAQVINLLKDLREQFGIAYLFISHDLAVVRQVADRIIVMYLGRIAEQGTADEIFAAPAHPYTQALLSAVPVPDPSSRESRDSIVLEGDVPSPADPPSGCRFRTRCWKATQKCADEVPLLQIRPGVDHEVACHYADTGVRTG